MLGDFITRGFILAFGYAYPAFECFKTLEKNKVNIEELRFWCQYWIIVASITVFERIGDIFISWIPMYGEAKLALFIFLWFPKTKGCGYIYDAVVRPFIAKHETDIDRSLQELRARGMDLVIYYWRNCAMLGQTKIFEILHYFASHSANITHPKTEVPARATTSPPPPSSPSTPSSIVKKNIKLLSENSRQLSTKVGRPPNPVSSPTATARHAVGKLSKARTFQFQAEEAKTSFDHMVDQNGGDHDLHSPTLKNRRSKSLQRQ